MLFDIKFGKKVDNIYVEIISVFSSAINNSGSHCKIHSVLYVEHEVYEKKDF